MSPLAGLRAWIVTDGKAGDENTRASASRRASASSRSSDVSPAKGPFHLARTLGADRPPAGTAQAGRRPARPPPRSRPRLRPPRRAVLSGLPKARRAVHGLSQGSAHGRRDRRLHLGTEHDTLRGPNVLTTVTHRIACLPSVWPRRVARRTLGFHTSKVPGLRCSSAATAGTCASPRRRSRASSRSAAARLPGRELDDDGLPPHAGGPARGCERRCGGDWRLLLGTGPARTPNSPCCRWADAVVVTSDSVNMVSEAVATGVR